MTAEEFRAATAAEWDATVGVFRAQVNCLLLSATPADGHPDPAAREKDLTYLQLRYTS